MTKISPLDFGGKVNAGALDGIVSSAKKASVALSNFPHRTVKHGVNVLKNPATFVGSAKWMQLDNDGTNKANARKPLAKITYDTKQLILAEIAVIVPLDEAMIEDASYEEYNIEADIETLIANHFAEEVDDAVFNGDNAPTEWSTTGVSLVQAAVDSGNTVVATSNTSEDISEVIGGLEANGNQPNLIIANHSVKAGLRAGLTQYNTPVYVPNGTDGGTVWDTKVVFSNVLNDADVLVCQTDGILLATAGSIQFKVLKEATLRNPDGTVAYDLAQEDMIAIRAKWLVGRTVLDATKFGARVESVES